MAELVPGEELQSSDDDTSSVVSVETESLSGPVKTFNFTVSEYHTYWVGQKSGNDVVAALVHNTNNTECYDQLIGVRQKVRASPDVGAAIKSDPALMSATPQKRFLVGADDAQVRGILPDEARIVSRNPPGYVTANRPWAGRVEVEIKNSKTGETFKVTYIDGTPDFSPYADTAYTKLPVRGEVWVKPGAEHKDDLKLASEQFFQAAGFRNKTQLDDYMSRNKLVWHHTVSYRNNGSVEMKLILIPRSVHNVGDGGASHFGGRSVYDFHMQRGIPLP